jgi:uncharacterized protein (TIRG00374 family)
MRKILTYSGYALGISLLAYFLSRVDWKVFRQALFSLHPFYLAASAPMMLISLTIRSLRWERLLRPSLPPEQTGGGWLRRTTLCWQAQCLGGFCNCVYPAKAGEAVRMYRIHKTLGVDLAQTATLGVLDRLLDVAGVLLLGFLATSAAGADENVRSALITLLIPLAAFGGLAAFLNWQRKKAKKLLALILAPFQPKKLLALILTPFPPLLPFLHETSLFMLDRALQAAGNLRSPVTCGFALACSLLALLGDAAVLWVLLRAFGWTFSFHAALLLEISFCIAGCLPSAPAYIGLYQAAAVFMLTRWGLTESDGVAFALLLQLESIAVLALCNVVPRLSPRSVARQRSG